MASESQELCCWQQISLKNSTKSICQQKFQKTKQKLENTKTRNISSGTIKIVFKYSKKSFFPFFNSLGRQSKKARLELKKQLAQQLEHERIEKKKKIMEQQRNRKRKQREQEQ